MPASNHFTNAIDKAWANMRRRYIDTAIKKSSGAMEGVNYEESALLRLWPAVRRLWSIVNRYRNRLSVKCVMLS